MSIISAARWLDSQCAKLSRLKGAFWLCAGASAALVAISWLPFGTLIGSPSGAPEIVGSVTAKPIATGASGLPLPRFVSIKAREANVRIGPSREHEVVWTYTRSGLPVEITAEFENWRRIRDGEGNEGWVFHSLLSGERTAQFKPWRQSEPGQLLNSAQADARVTAIIENGALLSVDQCDGLWCQLSAAGASGYIQQAELWGVYPGERVR